jgi:hypothetical protein
VDATIAAALISGGVGALGIVGTVVTSVVGSKNTREATEQAIEAGAANTRATLAAARGDRLWEKRAAAYEETLAWLLHRQAKRTDNEAAQEFYKTFGVPGTFETHSRLIAYASDAVVDGYGTARGAHERVRMWYSKLEALGEHIYLPGPDLQAGTYAQRQLNDAVEVAEDANNALVDVIRDELRSRPEAAMPPAEVPAVHRGFLHRRKAVKD